MTVFVRPGSDRTALEPLGVTFVTGDAVVAEDVDAAFTDTRYRAIVTTLGCFKCDLPLIIHALGDAALDQCIAGLNVGQYVAPGQDRRTQLIHLQQVCEQQSVLLV